MPIRKPQTTLQTTSGTMITYLSTTAASFVSCNATAVGLMEKGRHEEAYNILKTSINRLQAKLTSCKRTRSGTNLVAGSRPFYEALAEEQRLSGIDTAKLYSVPVYTGRAKALYLENQQNIFSFYTKAFGIQAKESKEDDSGASLATIFVVLAYNMGLALFIGSTLTGKQFDPYRVTHNIRVFEAAMRALSGTSADPLLHSLVLALTFNLGYLHNLNYNFQETRQHLSLAVNLVNCPATEDSLSEDDYGFFYANMCMFADRGMELHLAPAA
jgi:hypothetical protein